MKTLNAALTLTLFCTAFAFTHSPSLAQNAASSSNMKSDGTYRYISGNGIPNHPTGQFPNKTTPYTIQQKTYAFRVPLKPQKFGSITALTNNQFFGIALNGIPFDPISEKTWNENPAWTYEVLSKTVPGGTDENNGDVNKDGSYVYRGLPAALMAKPLSHVGYAADGFPIFISKDKKYTSAYALKQGARPSGSASPQGTYDGSFASDYEFNPNNGNLDQCNGATVSNKYYIYILTEEFPYAPRCWSGKPDPSFTKTASDSKKSKDPNKKNRRARE